jgi:hypothetical protein
MWKGPVEEMRRDAPAKEVIAQIKSKPAAAIGQPPAGHAYRDGRSQRPPQRQGQIGHKPGNRKSRPKDFPFHAPILIRTDRPAQQQSQQ